MESVLFAGNRVQKASPIQELTVSSHLLMEEALATLFGIKINASIRILKDVKSMELFGIPFVLMVSMLLAAVFVLLTAKMAC